MGEQVFARALVRGTKVTTDALLVALLNEDCMAQSAVLGVARAAGVTVNGATAALAMSLDPADVRRRHAALVSELRVKTWTSTRALPSRGPPVPSHAPLPIGAPLPRLPVLAGDDDKEAQEAFYRSVAGPTENSAVLVPGEDGCVIDALGEVWSWLWSWCGRGDVVVWSWCGRGVVVVWSWCGSWCGRGRAVVMACVACAACAWITSQLWWCPPWRVHFLPDVPWWTSLLGEGADFA